MIEFDCPQCGTSFRLHDAAAGKRGKCKTCGKSFTVPDVAVVPFESLVVADDESSRSSFSRLHLMLGIGGSLLLIILLSAALVGRRPNEPLKETTKAREQIVVVTLMPTVTLEGRVIVSGTTNLPPETSLSFSLSDALTERKYGGSKTTVQQDGTFKSEPLGPNAGLDEGIYIIDGSTPLARFQPQSVQRIIGDVGQNLQGPLVESNPVFGNSVHVEAKVVVGGPNVATKHLARAKNELDVYRRVAGELQGMFDRLESSKNERLRDNDVAWGEFARTWTRDFAIIQESIIKGLGDPYARQCVGGPIGPINSMFSGIAFRNEEKYQQARSDHAERLRELNDFLAKKESLIETNGIDQKSNPKTLP